MTFRHIISPEFKAQKCENAKMRRLQLNLNTDRYMMLEKLSIADLKLNSWGRPPQMHRHAHDMTGCDDKTEPASKHCTVIQKL